MAVKSGGGSGSDDDGVMSVVESRNCRALVPNLFSFVAP